MNYKLTYCMTRCLSALKSLIRCFPQQVQLPLLVHGWLAKPKIVQRVSGIGESCAAQRESLLDKVSR